MKRILLIALPVVVLVGAFAIAVSLYSSTSGTQAEAAANIFRSQQSKVVSVKGVLVTGGVECQRLQATDGTYYTLMSFKAGDLKTGDVVNVKGKLATTSTCQQDRTIVVQSIDRISTPPVDTNPGDTKDRSGISGTVTIGPTCPGAQTEGSACADKPYATQLLITDHARPNQPYGVNSDKNGKFRITLPPGTYTVEPAPQKDVAKMHPSASPQDVVVTGGKFTEVTIQFDSGIR